MAEKHKGCKGCVCLTCEYSEQNGDLYRCPYTSCRLCSDLVHHVRPIGWLKNVTAKFVDGDSLDAAFTLTYDVAYKRAGWDRKDPAVETVHTRLNVTAR